MLNAAILAAAAYLPTTVLPIKTVEERIEATSEGKNLPVKAITRLTGVQRVYHRAPGENTYHPAPTRYIWTWRQPSAATHSASHQT